eukprot:gene3102-5272_t
MSTEVEMKIFLPVDEYPDVNFIGLLIGPRGKTQMELEKKTNTKMRIRGATSEKNNSSNEKLHVLITAKTADELENASNAVYQLLNL